jgi:hypothetical protein
MDPSDGNCEAVQSRKIAFERLPEFGLVEPTLVEPSQVRENVYVLDAGHLERSKPALLATDPPEIYTVGGILVQHIACRPIVLVITAFITLVIKSSWALVPEVVHCLFHRPVVCFEPDAATCEEKVEGDDVSSSVSRAATLVSLVVNFVRVIVLH